MPTACDSRQGAKHQHSPSSNPGRDRFYIASTHVRIFRVIVCLLQRTRQHMAWLQLASAACSRSAGLCHVMHLCRRSRLILQYTTTPSLRSCHACDRALQAKAVEGGELEMLHCTPTIKQGDAFTAAGSCQQWSQACGAARDVELPLQQ